MSPQPCLMSLNINSPCRGICKIDEPSQLCSGCLRSIDEITRWSRMDIDQKLAVLSACLDRQGIPAEEAKSGDAMTTVAAHGAELNK